jgi:ADP-heptose:LPS heptosyltransferase
MGWGDELMAAGEAARLHRATGRPVVITAPDGRPRWSEAWDGIPFLSRVAAPDAVPLVNAPGARPYLVRKARGRSIWRRYEPEPAPLALTAEERRVAEPYRGAVLVEPCVPDRRAANKAWPFERWEAVVEALRADGTPVAQVSAPGARSLPRVPRVPSGTFREACAAVAAARVLVAAEGGLMHAAAAAGTPAVILWSEYVAPEITGYPGMIHLRHAGAPCGAIGPCAGCAASLRAIEVDEVVEAVRRRLRA